MDFKGLLRRLSGIMNMSPLTHRGGSINVSPMPPFILSPFSRMPCLTKKLSHSPPLLLLLIPKTCLHTSSSSISLLGRREANPSKLAVSPTSLSLPSNQLWKFEHPWASRSLEA